jgi:hypothetical protein
MAMATDETQCVNCKNKGNTYKCKGCSQDFCFTHLITHRETLRHDFDTIENYRDLFLQTLIEQKESSKEGPSIKQIDAWEEDSINKIKQIAKEYKQILINYTSRYFTMIDNKLSHLTEQLRRLHQENEFNEKHLIQLKQNLLKLNEELDKPPNVSIRAKSTSFINDISVIAAVSKYHNPGRI